MSGAPARRMFTTSEYHRMGKAGILTDEDRVELTMRGYRDTVTRTGDDRLAPAALPRVAFRVSELLGR